VGMVLAAAGMARSLLSELFRQRAAA
jgi:hypothetical protein